MLIITFSVDILYQLTYENNLKYSSAFTQPTNRWERKKHGKKKLFSSSYEFLLKNCNKIYCFIKACWNLVSKCHQKARPSIFLCRAETTWELKAALSCFAFWETTVGLSNHHLLHSFCRSVYSVAFSTDVCIKFLEILFFIMLTEMCITMSGTVGTNGRPCAYPCTCRERHCFQLALPGTCLSNHQYYVQIFSNAVDCGLFFFILILLYSNTSL